MRTWLRTSCIGLIFLFTFAAANAPILLNYHQIGSDSLITHSPDSAALAGHIMQLQQHGYRLINGTALQAAVANGERSALLTFDDGFKSVVTEALPVLVQQGVTGTAFIIASRIGKPGYLSGDDLRTLQAAGWEIGNHTLDHAALSDLTPRSIRFQIQQANDAIEAVTGGKPGCVAYPYGLHNATVRRIVLESNSCAFTTGPASVHAGSDLLALPRSPLFAFDDRALAAGARATPIIASVVGLGTLTWLLPDAAAIGMPPATWTPTASRELGDGRYRATIGIRNSLQELGVRDREWSLNLLHGRGSYRAHAIGVARMTGPLTLAGTFVAGEGFGAGISLDLGGYGEAWTWWTPQGGSRFGIQLIPFDYARVTATWHHAALHATVDFSLPVPLLAAEGYPLRLNFGVDRRPYAGLSARAGANSLSVKVDTAGTSALVLDLRW
jgi:peptidoglycan/xylan/chitin deacetylase (PgdA/CDA1 family)